MYINKEIEACSARIWIFKLSTLTLLFNTACTSRFFFEGPPQPNQSVPTSIPVPPATDSPVPPTTSPTVAPTPSPTPAPITVVVKTIQPALAVRGMSCLTCHANISGNVITDFGYDDPIYMGGGSQNFISNNNTPNDTNGVTHVDSRWYNNDVSTWQTAMIQGSVYVPNAMVPSQTLSSVSPVGMSSFPGEPNTTLATFLTTPYSPSCLNVADDGDNGQPPNTATLNGVTPPAGQPPVVSIDNLTISAPLASEISALAPTLTSGSAGMMAVGNSQVDGLVVGGSNAFITNVQSPLKNLTCQGDVVIQGPLYLRNAQLVTNDDGCRLYVNGSVFIEGPISFVNYSGKQNIQISSSLAILMGISNDPNGSHFYETNGNSLTYRLTEDNRGMWTRAGYASGSWLNVAAQISSDFVAVNNVYQIKDSSNLAGTGYSSGPSYEKNETLAMISYNHILLNAPVVESRYLGDFQGVIISELALFALGSFQYSYDSVFSSVSILPLFKRSMLQGNLPSS